MKVTRLQTTLTQSQHGDSCPLRQKCEACLWDTCDQEKVTKVTFSDKRQEKSQEKCWLCVMLLHHQARSMSHSCLHSFVRTPGVSLAFMFQLMAVCHFSILRMDSTDGGRVSEQTAGFEVRQSSFTTATVVENHPIFLHLCGPSYFCTKTALHPKCGLQRWCTSWQAAALLRHNSQSKAFWYQEQDKQLNIDFKIQNIHQHQDQHLTALVYTELSPNPGAWFWDHMSRYRSNIKLIAIV